MKNILITVVSALNANSKKEKERAIIPLTRELTQYHASKGEIDPNVEADNNHTELNNDKEAGLKAYQSNEACCKYLISKLHKQEQQLDEVFAITTQMACGSMNKVKFGGKVLTSYKYFTSQIGAFCKRYHFKQPHIKRLVLTRKEEKENVFDATLQKIAEEIFQVGAPDEVKIYLDIAGGIRNFTILIQLLTKLLTYYGYPTEAYYTHLEEKRFFSCNPAYKQMNILDAVNEFICYGSARQLKSCFNHVDAAKPLIQSMLDFHDAIQLCKTDNLDTILRKMNEALLDFETIRNQKDNVFILQMMTPLIRQKFFQGKNEPDYCNIIHWCLENGYIQQALTIYTEMIPKYIFENNMITVSDALYEESQNEIHKNPTKSNLDAYIFYDKIMSKFLDDAGERVELLKKAIEGTVEEAAVSSDSEIQEIVSALRRMPSDFRRSGFQDFKQYIQNRARNGNSTIQKIAKFSAEKSHKDFEKMKNELTKGDRFLYELLGLEKPKLDTFDKKLLAADKINADTLAAKFPGTMLNISKEQIHTVMLDYIYVKAIRNQINHASSEENLKEHQKAIFISLDYTVGHITPDSIKKDLLRAIEHLQNCLPV